MGRWHRWAVLIAATACNPPPAEAPPVEAAPVEAPPAVEAPPTSPESSATTRPEGPPDARPASVSPSTAAADSNAIYRTPACRALADRYDDRLAEARGTCDADTDCARFGGVQPGNVCGGVTDAETAAALAGIRAEMDDAGCMALPYSCPAAEPRCLGGRCGGG